MTETPTYQTILKSSTIVGGSQGVSIFLRIIRTKVLAVLLGPTGVGLVGLYQAVINIANTISGLGIQSSGVRQIAEAAATGDQAKISRTIFTLRRVVLGLGIIGMALMFLFREAIASVTFGNTTHARAIGILSMILLFSSVSGGQAALIRGMRRIGDLAKLSILGALWGTIISIPIVYFWGQAGIVAYMVTIAGVAMLTSWWYARKIHIAKFVLEWREIGSEAKGLISLGVMLMGSALMTTLVMYLIRVMVVRRFGLDSAGLYHSATTLSNVYIGFILTAMGMDFYPRLTAASQDNAACNRLVNEQAEVGLLMAAPGLLATLTFAALVIQLFYSRRFIPAYDILQWQVLGTFIRVACWPMGFIQLAKGAGKIFFMTQFTSNAIYMLFIWGGIHFFGLVGTGIAFFCLYVFHIFFIYAVARYLTGFRWSDANLRLGLIIMPLVIVTLLLPRFLSPLAAITSGTILTICMAIYSLKRLHRMVGSPTLALIWEKIKQKLG
jgi:antigen flippase